MTRCLVTGGSSLLAKYLYQTKPEDIELESTYHTNRIPEITNYHLNVCDKEQVVSVFNKVQPKIVIHCAALGSVDYAEENFKEVFEVNAIGALNVADIAKAFNARFVYISTNAVYSGKNPPYTEKARCAPLNKYGKIKRYTERRLQYEKDNWLIIRPYLLYGEPYFGGRQNWYTTIVKKFRNNEPIRLVNDVFWQPTFALDCAQAIWDIICRSPKNEYYNVASPDIMSLYEFGLAIQEQFDFRGLITPIKSCDLPGIAARPQATLFNTKKIEKLGIKMRSIKEGLEYLKCTQFQEQFL